MRGKKKHPEIFLILFSYHADLGANFFGTETLAHKNAEKNLYWKFARLISDDEQFPKNKIRPKKAFWAILENQLLIVFEQLVLTASMRFSSASRLFK